MQITLGLFDHMVIQRTPRNSTESPFSGECSLTGSVRVCVTRQGQRARNAKWVTAGSASKGRFAGTLKGIAVGGPYDITVRIQDKAGATESVVVSDVLVGDVWILAGQSNMEGCGMHTEAETPHPLVRAFRMNDEWRVAKDPIHNRGQAIDPIHEGSPGSPEDPRPVKGTGPGVSFAKKMLELTGVPQGLIACAHGGTSMMQWNPALRKLGGRSLYGALYRRFVKNGSRVAGVAWYQGESDTLRESASAYTTHMRRLVSALRKDAKSPALPFVAVQLSRVTDGRQPHDWNWVQEQQRVMRKRIPHLAAVPAIDLELEDGIHLRGASQCRLGVRIAGSMHGLLPSWQRGKRKSETAPIELGAITLEPNASSGCMDVVVSFDNVVDELTSQGRPTGFSLRDSTDNENFYRVDLDGRRAIIRTTVPKADIGTKAVYYGMGANPYCNIVDKADRSLPVFGPIQLGTPVARTSFVTDMDISDVLPSAGKLGELSYASASKVALRPMRFGQEFLSRHDELAARAPQDALIYFRCRFQCTEFMKLTASIGYDGPIKVWIDGVASYHDPEGTNPAMPDDACVKFSVEKGEHEVLVAMASNNGQAWGIWFFLQRTDLSLATLRLGPGGYAMPKIVSGLLT